MVAGTSCVMPSHSLVFNASKLCSIDGGPLVATRVVASPATLAMLVGWGKLRRDRQIQLP